MYETRGPNGSRNGPAGIPNHPQILDTRTLAEVLHQVDHPELYEGTVSPSPVPLAPPLTSQNSRESAFPALSTEDITGVHSGYDCH